MWLLLLYLFVGYLPDALLNQTCKQHDVVEYLNITDREHLLLMTMPRSDWTKPLTITVDSFFISILAVVEKSQTITTYFWVYLKWKNDFISWDPQQFCNISHITVPLSYFWIPDLYFVEQVIEDTSSWIKYSNLAHDGIITAIKPMRLTSTCILDFYYFPFDTQKCSVTLISATQTESRLVLKSQRNFTDIDKEHMKFFVHNGEWHPLDLQVKEDSINGFSRLVYTLKIQRQASLYILALIIPALFLMILDLLSYYIPNSYNEKVNFKITLLLGLSVVLLLLNDFLPASSDNPPIIVIFFVGTMTSMAIGIMETILIMYIGGKILTSDMTSAGTYSLYEGLLLKSSSNEVQLKEEQQVLEDGVVSMLERICRDMHLVREQILSLQSMEKLETERAKVQAKIANWVFHSHIVLLVAFYITVFIKWKW